MAEPILSFKQITKQFHTVKALDSVSFDVERGEILGLLGANGAGKSTLLKIIGGIQPPDAGSVELEGRSYLPKSAFEACENGVISVYQELNLFCNMTVAENLFIGSEFRDKTGTIDWKRTYAMADALLTHMGLSGVGARTLVESLSVGQRQLVEIARAISKKPKILLLDEPTASLSENQIQWLFEKIQGLIADGTTVIYVSHRLDEVVALCNRCVILRDGKYITTLQGQEIERDTIVRHMVGRDLDSAASDRQRLCGEVLFSCSGLTVKKQFEDISFQVHEGEILGIAGLVGAGRSELLRAIFGATRLDSGTICLKNKQLHLKHPQDAIRAGITLVSEDRKSEGLFLPESAKNNLASNTLFLRQKFGFIRRKEEDSAAKRIANAVSFDPNRLSEPVNTLSGGNQQKIVIGKSLLTEAQVLLLDEPTRGVDVGAREEIYTIIRESAGQGKAVVLVSSDWEELTSFADRVVVMSEGNLVGELNGSEITQDNMLRLCTDSQKQSQNTEPKTSLRKRLQNRFGRNKNSWILAAMLAVLVLAGPMITPFFMNKANWNNIVWQTFVYVLLTLGQLIVILSGGIDLSISATMTVSSIVGMKLMLTFPEQPFIGILSMLAVGLAVGAFNGFVVVYGKIDAFVATLAVQMILQGVALIVTPKPLSPSPQFLRTIANKTFLKLPIVLYIGIVLFIVFMIFLQKTRTGRHLYAVGENATGSSWSGLPAKRLRLTAFLITSFMSVLAAFYMLGRSGAAEPAVDTNLSLNSIAYSLIGGGLLSGGKGSITGSLLAAFVISVLLNIVNHVGLNVFWQDIIRGLVIMFILIMYERRVKRETA